MDLASNIRQRRLEMGISQQELADAIGYKSRSTIAKIEMGENDVPVSKLFEIAKALDTKAETLIAGPNSTTVAVGTEREENARSPKKHSKTVAVVMAGGKSTRNLQNIPNQFINVLGKPVIGYVLDTYQRHPLIDEILIVCLEQWERIVTAYIQQYNIDKFSGFVPAGRTGIQSTYNGYRAILNRSFDAHDTVIFQESTRPFVTEEMITQTLATCKKKGSAIVGERMSDFAQFEIRERDTARIDRSRVVSMQSPDAYRLDTLTEIFDEASRKKHTMTESCVGMLLSSLGHNLNFCEGGHYNIKIVRQEDLAIFAALLKLQN